VLVVARTSKTLAFALTGKDQVFSANLTVIAEEGYSGLTTYQSTIHNQWVWKHCTTMKNDPIYGPVDVYQTFPKPSNKEDLLTELGKKYDEYRFQLLTKLSLGFTKLYNAFHNEKLNMNVEHLPSNAFKKKYGKETWNLYNHLEKKGEGQVSYTEAVPMIKELRRLHKEMDEAVLAAYGWEDIDLRHDFYEVDYLPESDNIRYTIHPDARKEVLKRLLLLNHERYAEEVRKGLHGEKAKKELRKAAAGKSEEQEDVGGQGRLF
jgi:hypothetical protein